MHDEHFHCSLQFTLKVRVMSVCVTFRLLLH